MNFIHGWSLVEEEVLIVDVVAQQEGSEFYSAQKNKGTLKHNITS